MPAKLKSKKELVTFNDLVEEPLSSSRDGGTGEEYYHNAR